MNRARAKWIAWLMIALLLGGCSDNVLFLGSDIMDGGESENQDTGWLDTETDVASETGDTASDDPWDTDEEIDGDSDPEEDGGEDLDTSEETEPDDDQDLETDEQLDTDTA